MSFTIREADYVNNRIQDVARELTNGNLVPVVGAGISAAPPAGLPLWRDFRDRLLSGLDKQNHNTGDHHLNFASTLYKIKPESVLEAVLESTGETGVFSLLEALHGQDPNPNHELLAQLCRDRFVRIVITTNFDCLLESALELRDFTSEPFPLWDKPDLSTTNTFFVAATEEEWAHPALLRVIEERTGPLLLLKLHGTLGHSNAPARGIVATLKKAA